MTLNKNRIIRLLLLIIVGIIAFYGFKHISYAGKDSDTLLSHISARVFNFNEFHLEVTEDLDINDFSVLCINNDKIVFENGKTCNRIPSDYGHCMFRAFYKKKLIFEFGHFRTNNWHTNAYKFAIKKQENQLKGRLEITGPDSGKDQYVHDLMEDDFEVKDF